MKTFKNIAMILVFALLTGGLALAAIAMEDQELSSAERRKLEQMPELTADSVFSGDYMVD